MDDQGSKPARWDDMRKVLSRVAVGPAGSRDLSREEAHAALSWILAGETSQVQAGVFLIAERLKRETDEENHGFLQALVEASHVEVGPAEEIVCLADPFDGYKRGPHFAPVVGAILAACGLPTYILGAETMPPKWGWTHRAVLGEAGLSPPTGGGGPEVRAAAERLARHGLAYVDVEDFCPPLHALTALRGEIAKRPCLATLEKLVMPLRGTRCTHVVSGWVHSGYETLMQALLLEQGAGGVLLVKGREGHVDPHVHRETVTCGTSSDGEQFSEEVAPKCYGVLLGEQPPWDDLSLPVLAGLWDEALHPKLRTHAGQTVRLLAGLTLCRTGRASTTMRGVGMAHEAIVCGAARAKLEGIAA